MSNDRNHSMELDFGQVKVSVTGKKYSVKELAVQFGVTEQTVRKHIRKQYPGVFKNGVKIELDEAQVTVVLKSLQVSNESEDNPQSTYHTGMIGQETKMTIDLEIALAKEEKNRHLSAALKAAERLNTLWEKKSGEQDKELSQYRDRLKAKEEELKKMVEYEAGTRSGLNHYQGIAEAGGLVKSDKEDVRDTYPDWAGYWAGMRG